MGQIVIQSQKGPEQCGAVGYLNFYETRWSLKFSIKNTLITGL